jgi:hypothetical protein
MILAAEHHDTPSRLQLMLVSAEAGIGKPAGLENREITGMISRLRVGFRVPIRPGTGNRGLPGLRASPARACQLQGAASVTGERPQRGVHGSTRQLDVAAVQLERGSI